MKINRVIYTLKDTPDPEHTEILTWFLAPDGFPNVGETVWLAHQGKPVDRPVLPVVTTHEAYEVIKRYFVQETLRQGGVLVIVVQHIQHPAQMKDLNTLRTVENAH